MIIHVWPLLCFVYFVIQIMFSFRSEPFESMRVEENTNGSKCNNVEHKPSLNRHGKWGSMRVYFSCACVCCLHVDRLIRIVCVGVAPLWMIAPQCGQSRGSNSNAGIIDQSCSYCQWTSNLLLLLYFVCNWAIASYDGWVNVDLGMTFIFCWL